MPAVEPVGPDDFDEIRERLLVRLNPSLTPEAWRRIVAPPWGRRGDRVGLVVRSEGRPVAFAGLLFAEMEIDGRRERLCNLTSWIAAPGHEAAAALPILALRGLDDHTLTTLTPTEEAHRLLTRLGFEPLSTHLRLVLPGPATLLPVGRGGVEVLLDLDRMAESLDAPGRTILRDHAECAEQVVLRRGDAVCHLVYTRRRRRRLPAARVAWISDPALFTEEIGVLQRALWRHRRIAALDVDERLLRGHDLPRSRRRRWAVPPLFRSRRLRPHQVGELYSELMLFAID